MAAVGRVQLQGRARRGPVDCNTSAQAERKAEPTDARILNTGTRATALATTINRSPTIDDALKLAPKTPWSLYGRGVAEMRKQRAPEARRNRRSNGDLGAGRENSSGRGIIP